MTIYSDEIKALRKHTIDQYWWLKTRDEVLGIQSTPPPKIIHHPRFFNPSIACQMGQHQWETGSLMGIPRLKCKKCGRIAMKGSYEGTETRREIRERHVPEPGAMEPNFTRYET